MQDVDKMNPRQEIIDTENAIRDFIVESLRAEYGSGYDSYYGVTDERIQKWKEKQKIESTRLATSTVEPRLIYFSDFYDLKNIIKKNWEIGRIKECFGEQKKVEFYLDELEKYRNTSAHGRDFLTHQEHLVIGICGELRTKIVLFRNRGESVEDYFPRIESINDNFGNSWLPSMGKNVFTRFSLSPDDTIEFIIKAIDPGDLPIKYYCSLSSELIDSNKFSIKFKESDIGINTPISLGIRSARSYRKIKGNEIDEWATFYYNIVPKHYG